MPTDGRVIGPRRDSVLIREPVETRRMRREQLDVTLRRSILPEWGHLPPLGIIKSRNLLLWQLLLASHYSPNGRILGAIGCLLLALGSGFFTVIPMAP